MCVSKQKFLGGFKILFEVASIIILMIVFIFDRVTNLITD